MSQGAEDLLSSPVADGGGGPRSGSEGAPRTRPSYHKPLTAWLRSDMTPPERRLWSRLRQRQLIGLRFRRQHPLGPYIADFYCHEAGLVIEIDGASHRGERKNRDHERDRWMTSRGLNVIRVRSIDVRDNLDGVLATIAREAGRRLDSGSNEKHPLRPR